MKNKLPRFRDALTFSVLLLVLPAVYPAQEAGRFQLFPPALQAGRLIEVEPQVRTAAAMRKGTPSAMITAKALTKKMPCGVPSCPISSLAVILGGFYLRTPSCRPRHCLRPHLGDFGKCRFG